MPGHFGAYSSGYCRGLSPRSLLIANPERIKRTVAIANVGINQEQTSLAVFLLPDLSHGLITLAGKCCFAADLPFHYIHFK